jgi:hypothetical protein
MAHAYATANLASGLAAAAFTWSNAAATNRGFLNDGHMDRRFDVGAVSSGVNVIVDLGAAKAVSAVALLNSNIAEATAPTVKVEYADDAGFTSGVTEAKAASAPNTAEPSHKEHAFQFASATKRYWRVTWAWTGSFTLRLGELHFAAPTALSRLKVYGHGEGEAYKTTRLETDTGELRSHFLAGPIRSKRLPFSELRAAEKAEVMAMFRATKGGALPLLWIEQQEAAATAAAAAAQECLWGKLEQEGVAWAEPDFGVFEPDEFMVRSMGREVGA